tara:strand:- start:322 stop:1353 length:1032 start_codon:yes stop_codon:yes gene_type:complete
MTIRLDAGNLTQTRSDLGLAIGTDVLSPSGSAASLTAIPAAQITGTLPAVNGGSITDLDANNLGSGTVPDARFPATLPAASGVNLTALNATNLGTGTVPDGRFPATLPAASGVNLTALNATNLGTGTVATARMGTGTASSSTFLRGDGSWAAAGGGSWVVTDSGTHAGGAPAFGVKQHQNISSTKITRITMYNFSGTNATNTGMLGRMSSDNGATTVFSANYDTMSSQTKNSASGTGKEESFGQTSWIIPNEGGSGTPGGLRVMTTNASYMGTGWLQFILHPPQSANETIAQYKSFSGDFDGNSMIQMEGTLKLNILGTLYNCVQFVCSHNVTSYTYVREEFN